MIYLSHKIRGIQMFGKYHDFAMLAYKKSSTFSDIVENIFHLDSINYDSCFKNGMYGVYFFPYGLYGDRDIMESYLSENGDLAKKPFEYIFCRAYSNRKNHRQACSISVGRDDSDNYYMGIYKDNGSSMGCVKSVEAKEVVSAIQRMMSRDDKTHYYKNTHIR